MDLLASDADRLYSRGFEEHPLRPPSLHAIQGDDTLDRFDILIRLTVRPAFRATPSGLGRAETQALLRAGRR